MPQVPVPMTNFLARRGCGPILRLRVLLYEYLLAIDDVDSFLGL